MKYAASLFGLLALTWVLWSGHYTPLLLGLGAASCLVVVLLAYRMGLLDSEGAPIESTPRLLAYLPWLLVEIVKANLHVARRILSPRLAIEPRLLQARAGQQEDLGRVVYANSITLTPGTVTVRLEGDRLTVHALTREAADGLNGGEMDRRVSATERRR